MHMGMVVVAGYRNVTFSIGIDCQFIVNMIVTVLVAVMPEMCGVVRRVFQRIANAHRCRVSGVQREHDGENERKENAHIGEDYRAGLTGCLFFVIEISVRALDTLAEFSNRTLKS